MAYISASKAERFAGLQGFAGPDEEQLKKSAAALKAALDLNPRGGYVKGSRAREALEKAIESVPDSYAARWGVHLKDTGGPLAELFRYRLAPETQQMMLEILIAKADRELLRMKEELRRREAQEREREKVIRETQQRLRDMDRNLCQTLAELCRQQGESSAICRTMRAKVAQDSGVRCP